MKKSTLVFFTNLSYAILSNLLSFIVSTLTVLIIPRIIGAEAFGYWQVYLFYTLYIGFLHFGLIDGVYLRIGGFDYFKLKSNLLQVHFLVLLISQLIIASIGILLSLILVSDTNRMFIWMMTALCLLITNVRLFFIIVLQATNRVKEYSWILVIDRVINILLILFFILLEQMDFITLIAADLLWKLSTLLLGLVYCRDIVFRKPFDISNGLKDTIKSIKAGMKILIATLANLLIMGIVRLGIEMNWDVTTFGKVSLTLSISNMILIFVTAIGMLLYPILRRTEERLLGILYKDITILLSIFLFFILVFYYPIKVILLLWLPDFAEGIRYMALLFPILVSEGKMALLLNPYAKTLREESMLMKVNIISLIIATLLTVITVYGLDNLNLAVLSITVVLWVRCIITEIYIAKALELKYSMNQVYELVLIISFVIMSWFLSGLLTTTVYLALLILYTTINRTRFIEAFENMKLLARSS